MEKVNFDSFEAFLAHLRTVFDKDDIEPEIIRCIAIHKSGFSMDNAHEIIEGFLRRNDRNVIRSKLTFLCDTKDYICLDPDKFYKFNYEKYVVKNIPYVIEVAIKDLGVAVGGEARKSLEETMKNEESCVYLFMAVTSINYFEELLNNRIQKGYNTVVFFPHKNCINMNANQSYDTDLNTWSQYLENGNARKYLDFYLINNKKYKHLYSSCITKNIVRYNHYEYRDDNMIHTGTGRIQLGKVNTSFYDMVIKEYECAFYEKIPLWKYNKLKCIFSILRRHLIKTIIIILVIGAIGSFIILNRYDSTLSSTISSIFILFTMIIGFLQNRINDYLRRERLKFIEK
ncbi:MAG: hypothetical protein LBQ94_10160 [Treponema sp.]|jgi:hypothetical protein|nr:hypothetical protein [Treponema sp.]